MNEKARIGVIGAGWWAVVNHIPVLQALPDCEVVAVNRLGAVELKAVTEKFGVPLGYEDYRQMLDEVPMDGVVISSPHTLHFEHAKAALEKGCHVLVEKPLTTSAADARALVALAKSKGKQIVVPYGWNFRPFAAEARRLAAGVGKIEYFNLVRKMSFRQLRSIVFDQMLPKIANYWPRDVVEQLMHGAGLVDIKLAWVNEMSWSAIGTKPNLVSAC